MIKKLSMVTLVIISTIFVSSFGYAYVIQYDAGDYTMPVDNATFVSRDFRDNVDLNHDYFYFWTINDVAQVDDGTLQIVFHDIYNWRGDEANWLNAYIRNGGSNDTPGFSTQYDDESRSVPNWGSWLYAGTWSYPIQPDALPGTLPSQHYDVAFVLDLSTVDPNTGLTLANYLTDGGTFVIGFDPDCLYYSDGVTVNAPVPEPATLLLLGTGLLGIAGFRRKS